MPETPDQAVHPDGLPPGQRGRALASLAGAVGMAVLGSALPDVALPHIAADLAVTPADSVWIINAYQIAIIITLLPFASLGDIHGYRRVYRTGLCCFLVGVTLCTFAPTLPLLVAARVLQGLGAAGIMSVNTALVRYTFPRAMLGRGMGFNALVVATSAAIGPTVASAVLSFGTWHYLFAVNIPIGLAALALSRALPYSPRASHSFDLASAVLNGLTLSLFILALDSFGHGRHVALGLALFAATAAVGFIYIRHQLRMPAPMLPVDLFRRPIFALTVATSVCSFLGQTSAYVALPFLYQASGADAVRIGLMMTPWPVAVMCVAPIAGRLSDRFSAGLLGGIGLAAMAVGQVTLATVGHDPALWNVAWRMALTGAGFALFQAPNNRAMMGSVPRERSGAGSGMLSTARLLGQTSGAALVALVFALMESQGTGEGARAAVLMGAGFAALAAVLSTLRLAR
jgi:DHA2 family multidrug resistance protein-like MFS transporter